MDDILDRVAKITGSAFKTPKAKKSNYDDLFEKHGAENDVDPDLLRAMTSQESTFNPRARSPKNAQGLMQLIPATAQRFGVKDVWDPDENIKGGAKYMRFLLDRYNGDVDKALAGYNAGEGAVDKHNGIPPYRETQDYVKKIRSNYKGNGYLQRFKGDENELFSGVDRVLNQPAAPAQQPPQDDLLARVDSLIKPQAPTGDQAPEDPHEALHKLAPIAEAADTPAGRVLAATAIQKAAQDAQTWLAQPGAATVPAEQPVAEQQQVEKRAASAAPQSQEDLQREYETWRTDLGLPHDQSSVDRFNAERKARFEQDQIVDELGRISESAKKGKLSPDAAYREFIQKNNLPHSQSSIDLFNKDVERRNAEARKKAEQQVQKQTASAKPRYTNADFRAWAKYNKVPMNATTRKSFEAELDASDKAKFGKGTEISYKPGDFQVGETPVTSSEFEQATPTKDGGQLWKPRQIGTATDDLARVAGQYQPPADVKDEATAFKQAILNTSDATPEQVDAFIRKKGGHVVDGGYTPGDIINVRYDTIAEIQGKDSTIADIRNEQAQGRTDSNVGIDLSASKDWVKEDVSNLREALGPKATEAIGGYLGSGARIARSVAGVLRPINTDAYEAMQEVAKTSERFENEATQKDGWGVFKLIGGLPGDLSRLYLMTKLPGSGPVVGFAADSGLQSSGRGESLGKIAKEAAKGGVLGSIFKFAPLAGRVAAASPAVKSAVGKVIFREAATLGTIFTGSVATEKAFGSSDEQAIQSGVVNALFHLANTGANLFGKRVRARDEKGNEVNVGVDNDGSIKLLKGEVAGKPDVEMYFDEQSKTWKPTGAENATTNEAAKEAQVVPDGAGGYTREVKGLLGEDTPQRIEQPDPSAVQKAGIDTRTRKVADALKHGEFTTVEDIAKATKMNKTSVEDAVLTLYGAGHVELLPGNRVRLIEPEAFQKKTDIFERAKTYGQAPTEVPSQSAPMAETSLVSDKPTSSTTSEAPVTGERSKSTSADITEPEPTAKPQTAAAPDISKFKGQTVTNPQTREQITFTGEVSENGTLIGENAQGRERRMGVDLAEKLLAEKANAPIAEPTTENQKLETQNPQPQAAPIKKPAQRPFKDPATARRGKGKFRDLTQAVRAAGGIRPDATALREGRKRQGELDRLNPKETGTTGLINKNSRYSAEQMAQAMWESGYLRDIFPTVADINPETFLDALESDFNGSKKQYSSADDTDRIEQEIAAQEEEYYKAKAEDPEAREEYARRQDELLGRQIALLNDDDSKKLLAKVSEEAEYDKEGNVRLPAELKREFDDKLDQFGLEPLIHDTQIIDAYREALAERESPSTIDLNEGEPQGDNEVARPAKRTLKPDERAVADDTVAQDVAKQVDLNDAAFYEDAPAVQPHAIGNYIEFFGDDAKKIAKALDLTLTKDKTGTPVAGVPEHSWDVHRAELEKQGIAVNDPVEGKPTAAKTSEKVAEKAVDRRPTLHGVAPQELTPTLTARVLYEKEKGTTPADIAEKYNLTPEQVASVGELPAVGTTGQMAHKLIQAMIPAKQATPTERAEKIALVNDLAAEMGVPARLTRDTKSADIKEASDAIRLAIATEMGKARSSELTPKEWVQWLENHADKLSFDTISTLLDAFGVQTEHSAKVEQFTGDKMLKQILIDTADQFGLENLKTLADFPRETRSKIYRLGLSYGLKRTATERALGNALIEQAKEESKRARDEKPREENTAAGETEPAAKGSREKNKLGKPDVLFSRTSPDERNLVAVHNLSASKILFADKLGGIALPSIAVKNVEHEFGGYGEISLLASPDLIDPKRGTTVTDSDQYSPRYPEAKVIVDSRKMKPFWDKVVANWREHYEDPSGYSMSEYGITADLEDRGARALEQDDRFAAYVLKNQLGLDLPKESRELYKLRNEHSNAIEQAAQDAIEEVEGKTKFFSHWTNMGNKSLKDYTLDNIVKKLKSEMKEGEGWFYGSGNVRSKAAKRFRSVAQIKKERGRLVQSMDDVKEEMNSRLIDLANDYDRYNTRGGDSMFVGDGFGKALAEGLAERNLRGVLKEYGYEIPSDEMDPIYKYLDDLRTAPTEYFEAVPKRAVALQEFTAAVIPDSTPQKVRDVLKRKGIAIHEYKKGDEADRAAKVKAASQQLDILFSRGNQKTETPKVQMTQVDLFGNEYIAPEPVAKQASLFEMAQGFADTPTPTDTESTLGKKTADFLKSMAKSSDKKIAKAATTITDRVKFAGTQGATSVIEDAADALDLYSRAVQTKAPLEDMFRQGWIGQDVKISERVKDLARSIEKGDIGKVLNAQLLQGNRPETLFQAAWHGSPHTFDKFDISKIGTGEGAQAYGHGLYFTDKEDVADYYRNKLARGGTTYRALDGKRITSSVLAKAAANAKTPAEQDAWNRVRRFKGFSNPAVQFSFQFEDLRNEWFEQMKRHEGLMAGAKEREARPDYNPKNHHGNESQDYQKSVDFYKARMRAVSDIQKRITTEKEPQAGAKYRVDLKPSEDEYLLWDKPLSEQSEKVKKALLAGFKERQESADALRARGDEAGGWFQGQARYVQTQADALRPSSPDFETFFRVNGGYAGILSEENLREMYEKEGANREKTGSEIYRSLEKAFNSAEQASKYLHSLGIRGNKYLDGTSRQPDMYQTKLWNAYDKNNGDVEATVADMLKGIYGEKPKKDFEKQVRRDIAAGNGKPNYNYVIFDDADVEILETHFNKKDIAKLRRHVNNTVRSMSHRQMLREAKFTQNPDNGLVEMNEAALESLIGAFQGMKVLGKDGGILGAALDAPNLEKFKAIWKNAVENTKGKLPVESRLLQKMLDSFDKFTDPKHGDIAFAYTSPRFKEVTKFTAQEELNHLADIRTGVNKDATPFEGVKAYKKAARELIVNQDYEPRMVHKEIIGKIGRDDAAESMKLTEAEVDELRDIRDLQLARAGVTPEAFLDAYAKISDANKRRAEKYGKPSTGDLRPAERKPDSGDDDGPLFRSESALRRSGGEEGSPTSTRTPTRPGFERLRQTELLSASRSGNESLISPAERQEIAKDVPGLNLLFSRTAPLTPKEASFWNKWIKNKRETEIPQIIVNFRRAGLLTGFKTHLRNMVSNAANQVSEEAVRMPAFVADLVASGFTGQRSVQPPSPTGIVKSFLSLVHADKTLRDLDQESGIGRAWNIIRNGDVAELKKNQVSEMRSGLPLLDMFINGTFRALGAEDALFKTYAMRRSLEAQARTTAINEARAISKHNSILDREKFINRRQKEILANPSKGMLMEAMMYADFTTYTNNNPISDWFRKVKDASKAGRSMLEFVVPYDRTPTNIVLRTLEYSPAGLLWAGKHLSDRSKGSSYTFDRLRQDYMDDFERLDENREAARRKFDQKFKDALREIDEKLKTDPGNAKLKAERSKIKDTWAKVKGKRSVKDGFREADRKELEDLLDEIFPKVQQMMFANSVGRSSLGSAAILLGMYLGAKGLLSGIWDPGDKAEQNEFYQRRDRGILNGSLKLGNRRYQINDSPMGKSLVLGASLWERSQKRRKGESEGEDLLMDTADVGGNLIMEQPMLNSLNDYFGKNKTLEKRLGGLLGSFVPTIVSDIADVSDDQMRRNEKIQDATMSRIPGLRQQLPKGKYPREPYMKNLINRVISKIDPTNSRPVK